MTRRQILVTAFIIDAFCWASVGFLFAYTYFLLQ
jgi:hypothetical protein